MRSTMPTARAAVIRIRARAKRCFCLVVRFLFVGFGGPGGGSGGPGGSFATVVQVMAKPPPGPPEPPPGPPKPLPEPTRGLPTRRTTRDERTDPVPPDHPGRTDGRTDERSWEKPNVLLMFFIV